MLPGLNSTGPRDATRKRAQSCRLVQQRANSLSGYKPGRRQHVGRQFLQNGCLFPLRSALGEGRADRSCQGTSLLSIGCTTSMRTGLQLDDEIGTDKADEPSFGPPWLQHVGSRPRRLEEADQGLSLDQTTADVNNSDSKATTRQAESEQETRASNRWY